MWLSITRKHITCRKSLPNSFVRGKPVCTGFHVLFYLNRNLGNMVSYGAGIEVRDQAVFI